LLVTRIQSALFLLCNRLVATGEHLFGRKAHALRGTVYSLPYYPGGAPRTRTERARNEYTVPAICAETFSSHRRDI
jgi:hypothetical protein